MWMYACARVCVRVCVCVCLCVSVCVCVCVAVEWSGEVMGAVVRFKKQRNSKEFFFEKKNIYRVNCIADVDSPTILLSLSLDEGKGQQYGDVR